jgi:hypothetical protein
MCVPCCPRRSTRPLTSPRTEHIPAAARSPPPVPQPHPAAQQQPLLATNLRKHQHYMTSDDLLNALPAEDYTALDASSHLDIDVRAKLHKSIGTSSMGNQLDLAVAAPFGYQTLLQHSRSSQWNSLARGLALTLTGPAMFMWTPMALLILTTSRRPRLPDSPSLGDSWPSGETCSPHGRWTTKSA